MESEEDINKIEIKEPQITSLDPNERKLARQLRIQRRVEAVKKQQQLEEGEEFIEEEKKKLTDQRTEESEERLEKLILEGKEMVTNLRIANDAREIKRKQENSAARKQRLKKTKIETASALKKFNEILKKWESTKSTNDPLDFYYAMEEQKEKCIEFIAGKDALIRELYVELDEAEIVYEKDQKKQKDDLILLADRINKQINIMRRAYKTELGLIEDAILTERKQLQEANTKKWDALYKERDKVELENIYERFDKVITHEEQIDSINVEHQELFREIKIKLETDIQILQQEFEQVKAVCMMNTEKLNYNYQVLKKKDEENLIIKTQQKRRINRLQDIINRIRHKIADVSKNTVTEAEKLTDEVYKIHGNILDIDKKAQKFTSLNDHTYNKVWDMNENQIKELVSKVLDIDKILYEQQLGIEWSVPVVNLINKKALPSYKSAEEYLKELYQDQDYGFGEDKSQKDFKANIEYVLSNGKLNRHILEKVADKSGFLLEEKMIDILKPYLKDENTLLKIDNVFQALGITSTADIALLIKYFIKYGQCELCQNEDYFKNKHQVQQEEHVSEEQIYEIVEKSVIQFRNASLRDGEELAYPSTTLTTNSYPTVLQMPSSKKRTKSILAMSRNYPLHEPEKSMSEYRIEEKSEKKSCFKYPHCNYDHPIQIDSIYVLKALKDFCINFAEAKERAKRSDGNKSRTRQSISRCLKREDVAFFWSKFKEAFPAHREKLWDGLLIGLQKYHAVLQERHNLNAEATHLKRQNNELKRLLQKYISAENENNAIYSSKEHLPPIGQTK